MKKPYLYLAIVLVVVTLILIFYRSQQNKEASDVMIIETMDAPTPAQESSP